MLSGRGEAQPFPLFYLVISDIDRKGVTTFQLSRNLLMNMGKIKEKKRTATKVKLICII